MQKIIINYEMIKKYEEKNKLMPKEFFEKCEISYYATIRLLRKKW